MVSARRRIVVAAVIALVGAGFGAAVAASSSSAGVDTAGSSAAVAGEQWTGTIGTSTTRQYNDSDGDGGVCMDSWQGTLSLSVASNNVISGTGTLTSTSFSCTFYSNATEITGATFSVSGTQSKSNLTLVFGSEVSSPAGTGAGSGSYAGLSDLFTTDVCNPDATTGPQIQVPITDATHASGTSMLQYVLGACAGGSAGDTLTANTTIALTSSGCDPDSYDNAERKYATAEQLVAQGEKDLDAAKDGDQDLLDDTANETVKAGGIGVLIAALEHGLELTPTEALAAEIAHILNDVATISENISLNSQDWTRLTDDARSEFEHAAILVASANNDMASALCPDEQEAQFAKLLAEQKLDDDARTVIESWDNNGNLYLSKISNEWVEADRAFAEAKAALSAAAAPTHARDLATTASNSAFAAHIRAAISALTGARGYTSAMHANLLRLKSATATALNALAKLPAA
jgi:hypothetical protein